MYKGHVIAASAEELRNAGYDGQVLANALVLERKQQLAIGTATALCLGAVLLAVIHGCICAYIVKETSREKTIPKEESENEKREAVDHFQKVEYPIPYPPDVSIQHVQAASGKHITANEKPHNDTRKKITDILFSFKGRITRSEFWWKGVLPMFIVVNGIPSIIFTLILLIHFDGVHRYEEAQVIAGISFYILLFISVWPCLALHIKRLHDRNYSGRFLLTFLIPFVGIIFGIWFIVETWFLRGTVGPNRFGEDPFGSDDTPITPLPRIDSI